MSGALAGELYGSVVLAGHIDSRERGVGFFAKLLDAKPGDRIELTGGGLALTYVVRSNREVDKGVLSTQTDIFDRFGSRAAGPADLHGDLRRQDPALRPQPGGDRRTRRARRAVPALTWTASRGFAEPPVGPSAGSTLAKT